MFSARTMDQCSFEDPAKEEDSIARNLLNAQFGLPEQELWRPWFVLVILSKDNIEPNTLLVQDD